MGALNKKSYITGNVYNLAIAFSQNDDNKHLLFSGRKYFGQAKGYLIIIVVLT